MNDSYANVYINKKKRKEKLIALNHKRPKYDYSTTEANNNKTKEKEKENDIDNEMRMYTDDIDHFNFLNSFAQVKERKQSSNWKDGITFYDQVINILLKHIIDLTQEEASFNSIKSSIKECINQSDNKEKYTAYYDHLIIAIDKAKALVQQKAKNKDLKLSLKCNSVKNQHQQKDTLYSLFKRNKSSMTDCNKKKKGMLIKTNTFHSPYLNPINKPLIVYEQYNTVKSPKLKANLSTPKTASMNFKSNHSAFNYFSNLLKRDSKSKASQSINLKETMPIQVFKTTTNSKNAHYKSINFSNLNQEIDISPIIRPPQLMNNPNVILNQEEPTSAKSKECNVELLSQIKSSLDDNLKVMFNFSYENFLNKESERESKYSNED